MSHKKSILLSFTLIAALVTVAIFFTHRNNVNYKESTENSDYSNIQFRVLSEWDDNYRLHAMYPVTPNEKINKQVEEGIDEYVANFRAAIKDKKPDSRPFELNINADVDYATDEAVHIVFDGKQFIDSQQELEVTRLFLEDTGEILETSDLFNGDEHLTILSDETRKMLPDILGENYDKTLAEKGTQPIPDNFDEYEIKDFQSFNVVFEPGQVADKDLGIVKVTLPLELVDDEFSDTAVRIFGGEINTVSDSHSISEQTTTPAPTNVAPQQNSTNTDCSVEKCIAITFDDGPGAPTNELLSLLEQYNAKASFFYIGRQVPAMADKVKAAHVAGHDVGNHTWDHIDMAHSSDEEVKNQINKTAKAISDATGSLPVLVRPPYGSYTQQNVTSINTPFILWNVDPNDWKDKNADIVYQRVMEAVRNGGTVVLSHEIYDSTIQAYKRIIPELISDGYKLVTITDMFDINTTSPTGDVYRSL